MSHKTSLRPPRAARSRRAPPTHAELAALTDERLAERLEEELSFLTARARTFALAWGSGTPATEAAALAKLSGDHASVHRQKGRVEGAVRCLREQVRRSSALTLEAAIQRFRDLSDEARGAKDFSAATRAFREASLLAGLYPEVRLKLSVERGEGEVISNEEWEALAHLRHQVRSLPAAEQVVEALPAMPSPKVGPQEPCAPVPSEGQGGPFPTGSQQHPEGTAA